MRAIEKAPQRLDGGALIGHLMGHLADIATCGGRQVGERLGLGLQPAEVMVRQLLDTELRQSQILRPGDALVRRHVHQMHRRLAPSGMVLGQHVSESPLVAGGDSGLRLFRILRMPGRHCSSIIVRILSSFPASSCPIVKTTVTCRQSTAVRPGTART